MIIFNSYVKLPEGNIESFHIGQSGFRMPRDWPWEVWIGRRLSSTRSSSRPLKQCDMPSPTRMSGVCSTSQESTDSLHI